MLSKPYHGWTDFQLNGTSAYQLSYLDDIAFTWLDQAIRCLETIHPFCVKGFLEPNRLLCLVSYRSCHILIEDDENGALSTTESSPTTMLDFCKALHRDIRTFAEDWAIFSDRKVNPAAKESLLLEKLTKLQHLITVREFLFGDDCCFL